MEESPNLAYIKSLSDGDFAFAEKFVQALKEEFQYEVEVYFKHMNDAEPRSAAELVSKIKQKFTILGLKESFVIANYYETQLQKGNATLDLEFRKMIRTVNVFLKGI